MSPKCNARNLDVQYACQRDSGHGGRHAALIPGGVVRWDSYGSQPSYKRLRLEEL